MSAPMPFKGLLHWLDNAIGQAEISCEDFDHQWIQSVAGWREKPPEEMTTKEIERCKAVAFAVLNKLKRIKTILKDEHMDLRDDYNKRIDERNRKDPMWREVHGLPPLEESE